MNNYYVTTPIYYVNDTPHIGHAYTTIIADTLARWEKIKGNDTYFLTGTDEHGLKIEQSAKNKGVSPQELVDDVSQSFRDLCVKVDSSPNDFIRTTESRHKELVKDLWLKLVESGDIYLGEYSGWYSVNDEAYFTEDEIVDGKAPSGHKVEWLVEKSYFFRLSKYTDLLLNHFDENPDFIQPKKRLNEVRSFVKQGLKDISISRSTFSWGIEVPEDPDHVIYVWLDALANYISGLGGFEGSLFEKYWGNSHHIIGKDILRFHAVYLPCFLLSVGEDLPKKIIAHGWWTAEGEKISKSKGNAIDPNKVIDAIGSDSFRYFLLREISLGSDGDFSYNSLVSRINSDLSNEYGNLVSRTLGLLKKYRASKIPESYELGLDEVELLKVINSSKSELELAFDNYRLNDALKAIWKVVKAGNKYVNDTAPWVLYKEGKDKDLDRVLYTLVELLRVIGIWTSPFLPTSSKKLLDSLGVVNRDFQSSIKWFVLKPNTEIKDSLQLFPRLNLKPEDIK